MMAITTYRKLIFQTKEMIKLAKDLREKKE